MVRRRYRPGTWNESSDPDSVALVQSIFSHIQIILMVMVIGIVAVQSIFSSIQPAWCHTFLSWCDLGQWPRNHLVALESDTTTPQSWSSSSWSHFLSFVHVSSLLRNSGLEDWQFQFIWFSHRCSRFNTSKETLEKDLQPNSEITVPWQQTNNRTQQMVNTTKVTLSVSLCSLLELLVTISLIYFGLQIENGRNISSKSFLPKLTLLKSKSVSFWSNSQTFSCQNIQKSYCTVTESLTSLSSSVIMMQLKKCGSIEDCARQTRARPHLGLI